MNGWWHDIEREILTCLERDCELTLSKLAQCLGMSERAALSLLAGLLSGGKVRISSLTVTTPSGVTPHPTRPEDEAEAGRGQPAEDSLGREHRVSPDAEAVRRKTPRAAWVGGRIKGEQVADRHRDGEDQDLEAFQFLTLRIVPSNSGAKWDKS